jgi:phosphoribosyl 1,2-cyclic phosphate phosphodiesterase
MARLSLEFLGSGTSVGVPAIGCECRVCASDDPLNKRLRSSVLLRGIHGETATTVVIDTSADFRQQMLRAKVRRVDAVVITHHHADHVVGIDDVRRFNTLQRAPIDCFATAATLTTLRRSFPYVFVEGEHVNWGLPALRPCPMTFGVPFDVGCLRIVPLELDHEVIVSSGFVITCGGNTGGGATSGTSASLGYCVDVKRIPQVSMERLKGVHTLVLDMLREAPPHPTHLSLGEALEIVARVAPRRAYLAHIGHEIEHRTVESRLPPHVRLAYDGLVVELD